MFVAPAVTASDYSQNERVRHAVGFSGGWISGSGLTYRRYLGRHFIQGTLFGLVADSARNAYLNAALSAGTYIHRRGRWGIIPPHGLKFMAGADIVASRNSSDSGGNPGRYDKSYYGAGLGLDIGNPQRSGLSLWFAMNYTFTNDGIDSPVFESFGLRPASGIIYNW